MQLAAMISGLVGDAGAAGSHGLGHMIQHWPMRFGTTGHNRKAVRTGGAKW